MSPRPQWQREGWRPAGPGACRCPTCGATVPTNALARASHARACRKRQQEAQKKAADRVDGYDRDDIGESRD